MKSIMKALMISSIALFAACNPQPQSCISAISTNVRVGETVNLSSCALDAKRLVWNFGDGSALTEGASVSHAYTQPGVYQVELKALSNKDKKWDKSTLLVNVSPAATRYLTRIKLNSFNITNPSGQSWDVTGGINPDIVIGYGLADSQNRSFTNPPVNEVALNQLPLSWEFETTVAKPVLSNAEWRIDLLDNDGVLGSPVFETMATFNFNPTTAPLSSSGVITLTESNFQIELHFVEL